jgi:hypothetical protein
MNLLRLIDWLRDRLALVVRIGLGVLVLLIVLDAIPAVVDKEHVHTAAEHLPGFWSVFGLLGCLLLVGLAKGYARLGIARKEDFYDE